MKKNRKKQIVILIIIIIIELLVSRIETSPWWFFIIPILIFGILIAYRKVNIGAFITGFIAGFIVWSLGNIYYDILGSGLMLKRMAGLFFIHKTFFLLITGLIGGFMTGLALYTGKTIFQAFYPKSRTLFVIRAQDPKH